MYQALPMDDKRRIFVKHETAEREIDPFIDLLRSVQSELHGKLTPQQESGFCYELTAEKLRLVCCWKSGEGISVTVPDETDAGEAFALLERHCARLNAKLSGQTTKVAVRRAGKKKE